MIKQETISCIAKGFTDDPLKPGKLQYKVTFSSVAET